MLPTADLVAHVYALVDDALAGGVLGIPARPGPAPAGTDAQVLTIALVRHLLGRPGERGPLRGFPAEVRRDWGRGPLRGFPVLPTRGELNRRVRWLWGALEKLRRRTRERVPGRAVAAGRVAADARKREPTRRRRRSSTPAGCAAPTRRPGPRVPARGCLRRASGGTRPARLGSRLRASTASARRCAPTWAAARSAPGGSRRPRWARARSQACSRRAPTSAGSCSIAASSGAPGRTAPDAAALSPSRADRRRLSPAARRPVAAPRNRVERVPARGCVGELTERLGLAHHGAKTIWSGNERSEGAPARPPRTAPMRSCASAMSNPQHAPERSASAWCSSPRTCSRWGALPPESGISRRNVRRHRTPSRGAKSRPVQPAAARWRSTMPARLKGDQSQIQY